MDPVISAENLTKRYGSLTAVDNISFSVNRGEMFGFLGPNGAGKTTTMKMIQCISPKSSGRLTVFDMDVDHHPREIKRNLGVLPQETNLDPDFTCFENLINYARYFEIPKKEAGDRADELLSFVQLEEKRDVRIERLSGGMKRRLLLARALINNPQLLILDEPTIGLDPQGRHLIWEKLKALQGAGNTIVLTTHYLEEAERLCNRLVIMDDGEILVEGSPQDLVSMYVGSDILEVEHTSPVIACLDDMNATYEIFGDIVQVHTTHPREVAKELFERCNPGRVFARPASLEDVFLKLTGRVLRD
ncbi:MAG: ABC transporter ATP-binding protein [Methanoregulaceae archaeon]|nr:ABC transporter ATP-binding protein [Methanoregulaceae archaeon]